MKQKTATQLFTASWKRRISRTREKKWEEDVEAEEEEEEDSVWGDKQENADHKEEMEVWRNRSRKMKRYGTKRGER